MFPSELMCRACLKNSEETDQQLITGETNFQTLKKIYTEMTLLAVSDDDMLPKCLCTKCSEMLGQFKTFKDTCVQSYINLRKNFIDVKEEMVDAISFLPELKVETCASSGSDDDLNFDFSEEPTNSVKRKAKREDSSEDNSGDSQKSDNEKLTFECRVCQKTLKSQKSLKKHLQCHEDEESESDSENDELITRKTKSQGQEKYKFTFKCTYKGCRKAYKVKEFLEAHMRSHEGIPSNVCDICNKPLSSIRSMQRHRKTHETPETGAYSCKQCHKVCSSQNALDNHIRKHVKGRTCICDVCGQAFFKNSDLIVHKQSHNEEKLFKCQICSRDFQRNMGLYKHMKKVHSTEVHICRICDKRFPSKDSLTRHCKITHTVYTTTENVYACKLCDVKCKTKTILRRHEELHTGERKYACPLCPKTFAHSGILKKHSYFHSGERPVHCDVCGKGFYQKSALDTHMNVHKSQWIAQGVPGITLHRPKKKTTNAISTPSYTPGLDTPMENQSAEQSSMNSYSYV